jgi:hypothetical protein
MSADPNTSSRAISWGLGAIFGVVLYLLSYGPASGYLWINGMGYPNDPPKWYSTLYAPLIWTYDHSALQRPWLIKSIDRYCDWWVRFFMERKRHAEDAARP